MGAQHQALRVLGIEALHDPAPQQARGAHLGDLEIEVHPDGPEKTQPPGKAVDVQTLGQRGLDVFLAVGQRESQFQRLVRAGFLHVVARDADRVELGHLLRRVLDDVADDPHARLGRVDVGVAHHELFEDVVLDRPAELVLWHALLFSGDHITGEHRQYRAVHRHRHRHLVERNPIKQDLHVLDRVDRHAGLADIASDTRVVAVIAAVRGQIEGHAHPLAASRKRFAVESVALLGGGKARVLTDRPRTHRVHRGLRAADERLEARQRVGVLQVGGVGRGVQRLDGQALRRDPVQRRQVAIRRRFGGGTRPLGQRGVLELGVFRGAGRHEEILVRWRCGLGFGTNPACCST